MQKKKIENDKACVLKYTPLQVLTIRPKRSTMLNGINRFVCECEKGYSLPTPRRFYLCWSYVHFGCTKEFSQEFKIETNFLAARRCLVFCRVCLVKCVANNAAAAATAASAVGLQGTQWFASFIFHKTKIFRFGAAIILSFLHFFLLLFLFCFLFISSATLGLVCILSHRKGHKFPFIPIRVDGGFRNEKPQRDSVC